MGRPLTHDTRRSAVAPPLVERGQEVAAIAAAVDRAAAGEGGAVVVEGDAGTGKTRLLAEARAIASERTIAALSASGAELEQSFPFGVMRQLLERPISTLEAGERRELFSGAAAPAEAVLRSEVPPDPPPRDALFSLVHGFFWLCLRLGERRPLLISVDDLHWVDEPSLRALAYLAARVEELPIAVLAAARTNEPVLGGAASALVGEAPTVVRLAGLSEQGTAGLLGGLLGSVEPEFASVAHGATGGNPFLVRELAHAVAVGRIETDRDGAREIADLGPATVARWTLRRLDQLPPAAGSIARSLAVLEQGDLRLLAAHAGVPVEEASTAVDRLAAAGIVGGPPLRLAHPIVRASLYREMTSVERERTHQRAAQVLSKREARPEAVASQLLRCQPRRLRWAADALRAAGAEAGARGDAEQAARMLRRALEEIGDQEDPEMLLELGMAETALHDPAAVARLTSAASRAQEPALRFAARGALAHAHYTTGDFRSAFQAGRDALDEIPRGRGGTLEAELLISYLMAGRAIPELIGDVRRRMAEPRGGEDGEVTPAELARLQTGALDAFLRGNREEARRLARGVDTALQDAGLRSQVPTLIGAGVGFVFAGIGDHDQARRAFDRCLDHALERGSPLETAEALESRVSARWWRGDVTGCLADVETILSLVGDAPDLAKVPFRMCQSTMLLERGDLVGAERALELPPELEQQAPGTWAWIALPYGRARLALAHHQWPVALEQALATGDRMEAIEAPSPEFFPWRSLAAQARAALGEAGVGAELAREELELAREIGSPRATGTALAILGAIGRELEPLSDAVEELDRTGALLERARARLALGELMRRRRRPRQAREPLREALDLALFGGSTVLAERAGSELRAAGGRPRRERTSGVDALTPRERQIAELAAAGLGNPEIAERLFITRKTVESHLRNVFRKLGVRQRREISAQLEVRV